MLFIVSIKHNFNININSINFNIDAMTVNLLCLLNIKIFTSEKPAFRIAKIH